MKRDAQAELANVREVERLRKKNDTQAKRITKYRDVALQWKDMADRMRPLVRHKDMCYGTRNFERECDCGAYRVKNDYDAAATSQTDAHD